MPLAPASAKLGVPSFRRSVHRHQGCMRLSRPSICAYPNPGTAEPSQFVCSSNPRSIRGPKWNPVPGRIFVGLLDITRARAYWDSSRTYDGMCGSDARSRQILLLALLLSTSCPQMLRLLPIRHAPNGGKRETRCLSARRTSGGIDLGTCERSPQRLLARYRNLGARVSTAWLP
jgi:hypothetical protein